MELQNNLMRRHFHFVVVKFPHSERVLIKNPIASANHAPKVYNDFQMYNKTSQRTQNTLIHYPEF